MRILGLKGLKEVIKELLHQPELFSEFEQPSVVPLETRTLTRQ